MAGGPATSPGPRRRCVRALGRESRGMRIEVYVIGCAKCRRLERNLEQALKELGMEVSYERLEDIEEYEREQIRASTARTLTNPAA